MKKVEICPSILSANILELKDKIPLLEKAGIRILHFDVMDGHFVQNISFGVELLKNIKSCFSIDVDVHLMVTNPLNFIEPFCKAGAFSITFHIESEDHALRCIEKIKQFDCRCAIAINPETNVEKLFSYLDFVDMVVIMTVVPGFGGQKFIVPMLEKIEKVRNMNRLIDLQVDGGINFDNIKDVVLKGANFVVAGAQIFKLDDVFTAVENLKLRIKA